MIAPLCYNFAPDIEGQKSYRGGGKKMFAREEIFCPLWQKPMVRPLPLIFLKAIQFVLNLFQFLSGKQTYTLFISFYGTKVEIMY